MLFTEEEDEENVQTALAREKWKVRELLRMKFYSDQRNKFEAEEAEIKRRRNLTEEEREVEDEKFGTDAN